MALGCVQPGEGVEAARAAVLAELRERGRWLLVFDNAESPAGMRPWLPGGSGHVLITSRARTWSQVAAPVGVDVLARPESVAILQRGVAGLADADADRLAARLGDLPLAIAQAAGFMAETGMPAAEYLELLGTRAGQLLDQADPGSDYPHSLAAVDPADRRPAGRRGPGRRRSWPACARSWARSRSPKTCSPAPPACCLASWRPGRPIRWPGGRAWPTWAGSRWPGSTSAGWSMHRLTQAILRDRLTPDQAAAIRALRGGDPGRQQPR